MKHGEKNPGILLPQIIHIYIYTFIYIYIFIPVVTGQW